MNRLKHYIVLPFLLWSLLPSLLFSQNIRFKHLTINDGLSQNAILAMVQDSDGFMWFGTKDGLNKYDGYHFTIYQNEPSNRKSISSNYITALFTARNGQVWIGTDNGILNVYSKTTNDFQRILLPLALSETKNIKEITSITQDSSGSIWVGTNGNGIFKIPTVNNNPALSKIKQITISKNQKDVISNKIKSLQYDNSGILWIGTENGLKRFDIQKELFTTFLINIKQPGAYGSKEDFLISSIAVADKNHLWLGTVSGLVHFNTENFSQETYLHHLSVFSYGWGQINKIVADKKGYLWLATPGELMRFDTITKKYESYKNDPLKPETISYDNIHSLCIDRTGIVWAGTNGMGIDYYDPKVNRFALVTRIASLNSRISGFSIRSIVEQDDRYVWIGSNVLYRWDRKTDELKSFETNSQRPNDFGNTGISSMIKSKDQKIWFASIEGLFVYDCKSMKTIHYTPTKNNEKGLPRKDVTAVFEDKKGEIWIVTENCLSKLNNREKGEFKHYPYRSNSGLNVMSRTAFYDDGKDNLYIGTKGGLVIFNTKKETYHTYQNIPEITNSLSNNIVNSICPDIENSNRYLWIGTSGGLNLFDVNQKTFKQYTQKDGLPNNVIYGILSDSQHNLWLSTNKGLSKFNLKTKKFRNYDVADGLQSNEFNTGAYFKSKKGELFFGGIKGMNYFFPEQIVDNPFEPQIRIAGLKVYSEGTTTRDGTEIKELLVNPIDKMTFTHRDDMIVFDFAALDFSAPEKNKYAYKLENFNDDWIYTDYSRTATFTNLPPGNYTLKVKGSNNDGIWNEKGITIPIKVLPHWTGTWWAYTLYFILLLLLLYFIRKYEMTRIKMKNKLELESKEFDTLKVLDQMKSRFFTNISHEFRTPLTLISGYAENLIEELPTNSTKKQVVAIDQNAKTLLKLINELLDISKLEAGKMFLCSTQQNFVLYLKHLFFSAESFAELKKIKLNFISDEEDIQVSFDAEKMEKIIMNLLFNALKFTPEGGEITLTIKQNNLHSVSICICDNGIGMTEEAISHIFNRFYQADNSDTRLYEGTGIGLALVKELIELHQGSIIAHRNENLTGQNGATFTIELPIGVISEKEIALPVETETTPKETQLKSLGKDIQSIDLQKDKKIIVLVEDNLSIRTFIKNILQTNYKIIEAPNGEEGIRLANIMIPDIIITDVMMPIMDGITMVQLLRKDEKTSHIPIIILSGKATLEDKLIGLETGIEAYLTKPFSVKELQLIMKNIFKQREQLLKKYQNKFVVSSDEVPLPSVDHKFLEKVITHIKQHLDNPSFSVELLADKMCLSPSQLNRKLQAIIDEAPGQLIRNIRLQRAADLIKQNGGSLTDICFQTGFNDQTYFSKAFKNQFGCSPSSYKKQNTTSVI